MVATLFCLVGLPGSGKSTWVAQIQIHYPNLIVVSPDRIRANLFGDAAIQGDWSEIAAIVAKQLFDAVESIAAGRSTLAIYDATNAQRTHRCEAVEVAREAGFTTVVGIWFDFPLATCLARNQQRSRQVPSTVLERMDQALQSHPPQLHDGFDRLYRITPATPRSALLPLVASWV
jgi:predicted kinase